MQQHHAIISGCLKWAVKKRLLNQNPAEYIDNRPKAPETRNEAKDQAWNVEDAKKFLETAKTFGPQQAAFYSLAIETGMRKGELCGLKWSNVDLDTSKILIDEQLVKPGPEPVFGPPKRGQARTIHISPATVELLRDHRQSQNELKMRNRKHYSDHGLVFAKEWAERARSKHHLGDPLQINNISQREFKKITEAAKVPKIKFHGLRHTCATLLLKAGVAIPVVSERLGHKGVEITMNVYQHVLPDMQEEAASRLSSLLQ